MEKLNCILVIDDDETSNLVTRIILNASGVASDVQVATNGKEAVSFMQRNQSSLPELILLDVNMPLMDGFEFLEYCHSHDLFGKSKVAMYSTSIRSEDRDRAKNFRDVIAYTEKPLTEKKTKNLLKLLSISSQES